MPNWSEQMTDSTANAAADANAVAPSASVSKKVPVWMTIATLDVLNAYIKRGKVATAKGHDVPTQCAGAHADGVRLNDPTRAEQPEPQANAATWEAIAK